jgi:hypothetical protein
MEPGTPSSEGPAFPCSGPGTAGGEAFVVSPASPRGTRLALRRLLG